MLASSISEELLPLYSFLKSQGWQSDLHIATELKMPLFKLHRQLHKLKEQKLVQQDGHKWQALEEPAPDTAEEWKQSKLGEYKELTLPILIDSPEPEQLRECPYHEPRNGWNEKAEYVRSCRYCRQEESIDDLGILKEELAGLERIVADFQKRLEQAKSKGRKKEFQQGISNKLKQIQYLENRIQELLPPPPPAESCTCHHQLRIDGCDNCGWFTTIPWNEREWGDEPLDPDDVWRVGDRVRWQKGLQQFGTVRGVQWQELLGGKLPLIVVRWDEAVNDVLIPPEQLWRIWEDQVQPKIDSPELPELKVGDFVEVESGACEILRIEGGKAELFFSVGCSVWRDLSSLKLAQKIEDEYGIWWKIAERGSTRIPIWHNPKLETFEHSCGEKYVVLERKPDTLKAIREGLRPRRNGGQDVAGWSIGAISPFWLEQGNSPLTPQPKFNSPEPDRKRCDKGQTNPSGRIERQIKRKRLSSGELKEYEYNLYRYQLGGVGKVYSKVIPLGKLEEVREAIASGHPAEIIVKWFWGVGND